MRLRIDKCAIVGAAFLGLLSGGYVVGSWAFCSGRFGCSVEWLVLAAIVGSGTVVGGVLGWLSGRFLRALYRATRVG